MPAQRPAVLPLRCQVLFNGVTVGDLASWVDSLLVAYLLAFGADAFRQVEETAHTERQLAYTFQVRSAAARCLHPGARDWLLRLQGCQQAWHARADAAGRPDAAAPLPALPLPALPLPACRLPARASTGSASCLLSSASLPRPCRS